MKNKILERKTELHCALHEKQRQENPWAILAKNKN